jgi:hypothetical protein
MRIIPLLLAATCVPLAAQQSVSQVAFSESKDSIPAFAPYGATTLAAARLQLDIVYPHGMKERGDLTVVYDPQGGHYFWRYRPFNSPSDTYSYLDALKSGGETVYAQPTGLINFSLLSWLFIEEHKNSANSLDAAERASIAEIERGLPVFEMSRYYTNPHQVSLEAVGREFSCAPYGSPEFNGMCQDHLNKIVSISQQGNNWRLVLRNRWDEEVVLDSKFNLVSTRRLTQPPEPKVLFPIR